MLYVICKLFSSISNRHQKLRLPAQPVLRTRSNTASYTQSLLTHYQRAKHLRGLFQHNYRAPQGSLCQKSDSHVVCRLQKYIPKYTPFQKPTQSKATVPPTYLLSQLFFLLNTCLRKTERTRNSAVRKQRSVLLSRDMKKLPKCTNVESNSLQRGEEAPAVVRQHRHLFPQSLSSHTPCTAGSTGRNHWQYPLGQNSCQTQHGSAVMQAHRRIIHRGKSFKMHSTSPPALNSINSIVNTATRGRTVECTQEFYNLKSNSLHKGNDMLGSEG